MADGTMDMKDLFRFVAVLVVAVVILGGAWALTGGEFTVVDVIMAAFAIAVFAIIVIRVGGFIIAIRSR
ncbi:hypothetical protein [Natrialbaceae archaeon AArc-T1-2]|uniref:hypothetical protein n=1 Tax=Natrialbaceae archaeon AArc-T1-2 TaxID=3053904 RepID=UPI00255AE6C1|nr:hypothetical protein [Natrialbaceae archaeon AArc-T1-2]WIV66920.1 hypothetical protein QQ977_14700 [Natrialbaceae archaeon AArc-T1-2]